MSPLHTSPICLWLVDRCRWVNDRYNFLFSYCYCIEATRVAPGQRRLATTAELPAEVSAAARSGATHVSDARLDTTLRHHMATH